MSRRWTKSWTSSLVTQLKREESDVGRKDRTKLIDRYDAENAKYHRASELLEKMAQAQFRHEQKEDVIDDVQK